MKQFQRNEPMNLSTNARLIQHNGATEASGNQNKPHIIFTSFLSLLEP